MKNLKKKLCMMILSLIGAMQIFAMENPSGKWQLMQRFGIPESIKVSYAEFLYPLEERLKTLPSIQSKKKLLSRLRKNYMQTLSDCSYRQRLLKMLDAMGDYIVPATASVSDASAARMHSSYSVGVDSGAVTACATSSSKPALQGAIKSEEQAKKERLEACVQEYLNNPEHHIYYTAESILAVVYPYVYNWPWIEKVAGNFENYINAKYPLDRRIQNMQERRSVQLSYCLIDSIKAITDDYDDINSEEMKGLLADYKVNYYYVAPHFMERSGYIKLPLPFTSQDFDKLEETSSVVLKSNL